MAPEEGLEQGLRSNCRDNSCFYWGFKHFAPYRAGIWVNAEQRSLTVSLTVALALSLTPPRHTDNHPLCENGAPTHLPRMSEIIHARPARPRSATVLPTACLQEGQQGVAAKAVAGKGGQSQLLARPGIRDQAKGMAETQPGLLAE